MRITVLIENSAPEGLVAEHGLSFYLEYRGGRYLLDAGESGAFLLNAQRLGVDLSRVEAAALSHGHYDHGDGFTAFFRVNRTAQIHARPAVQAEELLYGTQSGLNPRLFSRRAHRFDLADGPRELAEGLHLIPDAVPHEQALAAEDDDQDQEHECKDPGKSRIRTVHGEIKDISRCHFYLNFHTSFSSSNAVRIRFIHSSMTLRGEATLMRSNPRPSSPKIYPSSRATFAFFCISSSSFFSSRSTYPLRSIHAR